MAEDIGGESGSGSHFEEVIAEIDSLERPWQDIIGQSFLPEFGFAEPSVESIHRVDRTPYGRRISCSIATMNVANAQKYGSLEMPPSHR
jgi:hypothetical protein